MVAIRVFEPALCCNTGVCGPELDPSLVAFTADLDYLVSQGADIARHNLANDPQAFAENESVRAFLQVVGSEGLPLTTVDGTPVMTRTYPTRAELLQFAGMALPTELADTQLLSVSAESPNVSSGCDPSGCC